MGEMTEALGLDAAVTDDPFADFLTRLAELHLRQLCEGYGLYIL